MKRYFVVLSAMLLLAAGCNAQQPKQSIANPPIQAATQQKTSLNTSLALADWAATQETLGEGDSRLVLVNRKSEERRVISNSLNRLVGNDNPAIQDVGLLGDTKTGEEVYVIFTGEACCGAITAININTLKTRNIQSWPQQGMVAPTGDRAVSIFGSEVSGQFDNKISLVCFGGDTIKQLLTLGPGEVLNQTLPERDNEADVAWVNDTTVEFSVYKKVLTGYSDTQTNPLLRKQKLIIPSC